MPGPRSPNALQAPTFELVPLKGALDRAAALPRGATVAITASPAKGMDATLDLAEQLQAAGFRCVPHLSARMVRDRAHLVDLMARFDAIEVRRVFVVGGDAKEPGDYPDGLSLLRAMAEAGHPFTELGIPCYPEGHAFIADRILLEALREKAPFASYMTTQMCFDPNAIARWIAARRVRGPDPADPPWRARRRRARAGCWRSRRGSAWPTRIGSSSRTPGSSRGCSARAGSTAPTGCSRPSPRSSPTRSPGSSTCTCTRSTRSPSSRRGGGATSSGSAPSWPPDATP